MPVDGLEQLLERLLDTVQRLVAPFPDPLAINSLDLNAEGRAQVTAHRTALALSRPLLETLLGAWAHVGCQHVVSMPLWTRLVAICTPLTRWPELIQAWDRTVCYTRVYVLSCDKGF